MYQALPAAILLCFCCIAQANKCEVNIYDISKSQKYVVQLALGEPNAAGVSRAHFQLPGYEARCTIAYLNGFGTALGCEMDPIGQNYIQSDRTGIKEKPSHNNLVFRFRDMHFVLDAVCI